MMLRLAESAYAFVMIAQSARFATGNESGLTCFAACDE
jgi:hypothetical protein